METPPESIISIHVILPPDSGEETSLCLFNMLAHLQRTDIWKQIETNSLFWTESKEYTSIQKEIYALQQEAAHRQLKLLFPNARVSTSVGTNYYAEVSTTGKILHDKEGKFILRHAGFKETMLEQDVEKIRGALVSNHGKSFIQRCDNSSRQRQFRSKKASAKETQVAWYLPIQLHKEVRKLAKRKKQNVNQLIVQILNDHISKDKS